VAGTSAGIATVVTSHHSHVAAPGGGASAPASSPSFTPSAASSPPSSAGTPLRIAGGMWGAELINRQSFTQDSLVGSGDSLYAASAGALDRIDPATGDIVQSTPYSQPVPGKPVVMGNTVWVVWSYSGGNVVLHGYDARTLARVASVSVPAFGRVSSAAEGVLTGGPDGRLYLAAGDTVAVVDPATGHVIRRIYLVAGAASAVAVAPDGSRLYVGVAADSSFRLLSYDLATGVQSASSRMVGGGAGNLVATSGGVWGTAGAGMSERVWFAPGGDLARYFNVSQGVGAGLDSVPTVSGGAVWIGGSNALTCSNPDTGQRRGGTSIPTDHSIVEYFGSVTVLSSGRTYALYQDQKAQLSGLAALTPPAQC
jgi:outer membrane protein assembly factor BamB